MERIYDDLSFGITPEVWDSLTPKLDGKLESLIVIYGTAGQLTADGLVTMKTIFQKINNENNV